MWPAARAFQRSRPRPRSARAAPLSPLISRRRCLPWLHLARRADGLDNIQFVEMDAEQLTFDDASFDAVTNAYGLMFCPDLPRAIGEARRVLRPGGRFCARHLGRAVEEPILQRDHRSGGAISLFSHRRQARLARSGSRQSDSSSRCCATRDSPMSASKSYR